MKRKGYYSQSDLYCSTVYGSGIYEWSGQYVQDPLCGDNGEGHISPLLTNIITGEQFFVKRFNCSDKMYPCYRERILTPPVNDYILWTVAFLWCRSIRRPQRQMRSGRAQMRFCFPMGDIR